MPSSYPIVEEAARHCWSKNFLEVFREFFAEHAAVFREAPLTPTEEQNLEYYELFQRYLRLYESVLSRYIESLDCSVEEFYRMLADIKEDRSIKDKKLLHFTNYLIACTDYPSFYKVMVRAAKRLDREYEDDTSDIAESKSESKSESRAPTSKGGESKGDSKGAK